MRSLKLPAGVMVVLTIVVTTTTASAHDGHNHGPTNGTHLPAYDQDRLSIVRDRYQSPSRIGVRTYQTANDGTQGCAVGGCCSTTGCSINSNLLVSPQNAVARQSGSAPDELEQLSLRMLSVVRHEMQGSRDYNSLMADADDVVRAAGRMRVGESQRVSTSVMLDEARTMLTPLKRMNTALKEDRQADSSLRAVQDVGRLLVSFGRDLQSSVSDPARTDREILPPRPVPTAPGRNSGVAIPAEMKGVALLPANEQAAAMRQRTCPVIGEPLGSMGKPIRVDVSGQSVYVCCEGCVNAVRRSPEKYLTTGNYGPPIPNRSIDQSRFPGPPPSSLSGSAEVRIPEEMKGVRLLPANEQAAALRQRTCPVNGEPLGSMGKPIRVDVSGRSVYVCCAGCVNAVQRNPEKYLR